MTKTLTITYSGGTLNLLSTTANTRLFKYDPLLAVYKDGGIFRDSKISKGRQPVYRQNQNVVETMVLSIHAATKNQVVTEVRKLIALANEAFDYWRPYSSIAAPVYLTATAGDETASRYAMLYKVEVSGLEDMYHSSFEGGIIFEGSAYTSGYPKVTLTIERGEWMDSAPGSGTNVVNAESVANYGIDYVQVNLSGDFSAKSRIKLLGQSADASSRILIGAKKASDTGFQQYLSLSSVQPDAGVAVTVVAGTGTAITADADAPTGYAVVVTPATTANVHRFDLDLDSTVSTFYRGKYRWFLRYRRGVDLGSITDILTIKVYSGIRITPLQSQTISIAPRIYGSSNDILYLDLGLFSIYDKNPSIAVDDVSIEFWLQSDGTGADAAVAFIDLVFIPADESVIEMNMAVGGNGLEADRYLLIDSLTYPHDGSAVNLFNVTGDAKIASVPSSAANGFILPVGAAYNLYLTALNYGYSDNVDLDFTCLVTVDKTSLYDFAVST